MNNGATIVNTNANLLTITEATTAFAGIVTITGATSLATGGGLTTIGKVTGLTISENGLLNVNDATEATSTTDGSL